MSLCQTFREISHQTWTFIGKARTVSHQPLEETVTDNNIIEIKTRHPSEVITTTFNRKQEATTGADWEWWFTNSGKSAWFGVRVQAKIIKFKSNRFDALYYKNQTHDLITDAEKGGMVPLYCFYANWPLTDPVKTSSCGTFPNAPESYGCSIVDAYAIKKLKAAPGTNALSQIMPLAFPWSCLVCCNGGVGSSVSASLPDRVRDFLKNVMLPAGQIDSYVLPEVVSMPPSHVIAMAMNEAPQSMPDDPNLAGVVIFVGNEG